MSQPPELVGRRSAEHWAGRLYMRRLSAPVTRTLIPTPITPNQLTVSMIVVGLGAAAVVAVPSLWTAVVGVVGVQVYLLLDCVDGELARWRRTTSATGAFLDRIGHYTVEAALLAAVGVRADGGYASIAGWTTVGLLAAVLHLLAKAETDLVAVARGQEGLARPSADEVSLPPRGVLREMRRAVAYVPFHRLLGAVELSLSLLVVALAEPLLEMTLMPAFVVALAAIAAVVAIGHAVMIVVSGRLR